MDLACRKLQFLFQFLTILRWSETINVNPTWIVGQAEPDIISIQNAKKVYFIDHALANLLGFRFSEDRGRMLENIVFVELKRRNHKIFYHNENKKCDFIIQEGSKVVKTIQVCSSLADPKTKKREIDGLLDAIEYHSLDCGYILTESEEYTETITKSDKNYQIYIQPLWKWLIENPD